MPDIRSIAAEQEIPLLDLVPVFRSYAGEANLYFEYDAHFTTAGHELMAGGFARNLREHHWSDWCE